MTRDLLSAFWTSAYLKHFDGSGSLVPQMHAGTDLSIFRLLGRVLAHGYLTCGVLPIRLAFLFVARCLLLEEVQIPRACLIESFIDHMTEYEG